MARKFHRAGKARRESMWIGITESNTVITIANGAVLVNLASAALLALRPFTIVRTHIQWFLQSDNTGALEEYQTAFGIAVVSEQSSGIGITAIPTPFTDLGSDLWFLHHSNASQFTFVTGAGFDAALGLSMHIDSKAMRKVNDDQDVVFVLENSSLSNGTRSLTSGRMLIKLH